MDLFEGVPDHVIVEEILARLIECGSIESVCRFGSTCRRHRALSVTAELWRHVDFTDMVSAVGGDEDEIVKSDPDRARDLERGRLLLRSPIVAHCESFGFRGAEIPEWFPALVASMVGLNRFTAKITRVAESEVPTPVERRLVEALCGLPNLKSLALDSLERGYKLENPVTPNPSLLLDGIALPRSLESLHFPSTELGTSAFFASHAGQLAAITDLRLTLNGTDGDEVVHAVASGCPSLRKLYLDESSQLVTARAMDELWHSCNSLEDFEVHIDSNSALSIASLTTSKCAPNLRRLFVNTNVNRSMCAAIGTYCTGLTDLKLCNVLFQVSGGIDCLSPLRQLRSMSMNVQFDGYESPDASSTDFAVRIARDLATFGRNSECVPLRRFKLVCSGHGNPIDLSEFFASPRCRALESVSLQTNTTLSSAEVLARIGTITGAQLSAFKSHEFAAILVRRCRFLRDLKVFIPTNGFPRVFAPPGEIVAPIRRLLIVHFSKFTDDKAAAVANAVGGTLEEVTLFGSKDEPGYGFLETLVRHCPKLRKIVVNWANFERPSFIPASIEFTHPSNP